jgi:hypothetical protein
LISRLIDPYSPEVASRESLIETLDILSDPEIMRGIARGLEDVKAGNTKPLDQISRDLEWYCSLSSSSQRNLRSLSRNVTRQ